MPANQGGGEKTKTKNSAETDGEGKTESQSQGERDERLPLGTKLASSQVEHCIRAASAACRLDSKHGVETPAPKVGAGQQALLSYRSKSITSLRKKEVKRFVHLVTSLKRQKIPNLSAFVVQVGSVSHQRRRASGRSP